MPTKARTQPWERQPDESPPAFDAFVKYRDMGATRSTAKVAHQLGKSKTLTDRWSRANQWVMRAAAWDAEQDRLWQLELREARRKAAKRNVSTAQLAMQKFGEALLTMAPDDMSAADAARIGDVAIRLHKAAFGEADVQVTVGPGGEPDTPAAALTDEERRARMEQLRRELQGRLSDEEAPA